MAATDTLILCYHAISNAWTDPIAVSEARFADQLSLLSRLGYRGVTFTEAVRAQPAGKRVAVTFDDAFQSVRDRALPILEGLGWPGTVFVVSDYGEGDRLIGWPTLDAWLGTSYEHELKALSWHDLGQLHAAGWEVGSHTSTHPHLTELSAAELRQELVNSRQECEARLGTPCLSIAYPYGDCNRTVVDAAVKAGYRAGAALPSPLYRPRRMDWPRVGVFNRDRLLRFAIKALPPSRRLRTRNRP
jgi:peptidoglycan/xylan/chitin deacetylase (PgdA/CDA1 family)